MQNEIDDVLNIFFFIFIFVCVSLKNFNFVKDNKYNANLKDLIVASYYLQLQVVALRRKQNNIYNRN